MREIRKRATHTQVTGLLVLSLVTLLAACGGEEGVAPELSSGSVGELRPIRGNEAPRRVVGGEALELAELSELLLDDGARLLLRGARLTIVDGSTVRLDTGDAYVEAPAGVGTLVQLDDAGTAAEARDAIFAIEGEGDGRVLRALRGEAVVRTLHDEDDPLEVVVEEGEEIHFVGDHAWQPRPTDLWEDWTGGLAEAGAGLASTPAIGAIGARIPGETGQARWPLVVQRLDVRVRIVEDLAITEIDQVFFNPASETVEGLYSFRAPEGALLSRFAVDRNGRLVEGYVKEKAQARRQYERQVYRGSTLDPALLEWVAPGRYQARIYPIQPGALRRVVVTYAEWIERGASADDREARVYRLPLSAGRGQGPFIEEMSFSADVGMARAAEVRGGFGATYEDDRVRIRQSDFRPRADLVLELYDRAPPGDSLHAWRAHHRPPQRDPRAGAMPAEDERDYVYVPVVLPEDLFGEEEANQDVGLDVVVVADLSAGTDPARLELGRSAVEAISAHLGEDDRIAVFGADVGLRTLGASAELAPATTERIETFLDALAREPAGGASDLGATFAAATEVFDDPTRNALVIYVGDGAPTVGELEADALLAHIARLPRPLRLYAMAVGDEADLGLLSTLTRGGGLAERIVARPAAAEAALRFLAHAREPVAQRVSVTLEGIEQVFPRRPVAVRRGDVLAVVGRVEDDIPGSIHVEGEIRGEEFQVDLSLTETTVEDSGDLRLRWAHERLDQLLLSGASREEVADLGIRYGLITPFTSFYVPSAAELSQLGADAWPLFPEEHRTRSSIANYALLPFMPVLGLMGCSDSEAAQAPTSEIGYLESPDEAEEEGAMGQASAPGASNRYGIEGPANDEEPMMAREESRARPSAAPAQPSTTAAAVEADSFDAPAEPEPEATERARDRSSSATRMSSALAGFADDEANNEPSRGEDVDALRQQLDATGYLQGAAVGDNSGFGGLGLTGSGRGGGGSGEGTIGLGNLGTIGHGSGGGDGSGYGRGAGRRARRRANVPQVRSGEAQVRGSLPREVIRRVVRRHINEVRFCYEQNAGGAEGRVNVRWVINPSGGVQTATVANSTLGNPRTEQCIVQRVRSWNFPAPSGGGVVAVTYPFVLSGGGSGVGSAVARTPRPELELRVQTNISFRHSAAQHASRRCSEASDLLLDGRRELWRERLRGQSGPSAWLQVYTAASRACEVPSWRDRRALLDLMLARAGNIAGQIGLYQATRSTSIRNYLRRAIMRRVRTPDDLRLARSAFGPGVDQELIGRVLAQADTESKRIRALYRLVAQFPDHLDLRIQLLEELSRADREEASKRVAFDLRAHPLCNAEVRTTLGEHYLRAGDEAEARRVFGEIVEFSPQDASARRRLGDLYRAHGWYEDAYRQYVTLAALTPDDPSVLLLMARAAAGAGRVDEALRLERRLAETAAPGNVTGLARVAQLWSSVRFAELRQDASGDDERLQALDRRRRASGVLRSASPFRATLVWSHPDADISLWGAFPGLGHTRPPDIAPAYGIEAFDVPEFEDGTYRVEVRRSGERMATTYTAKLVFIWNEGRSDERVEIRELSFGPGDMVAAFEVEGTTLREATPSRDAQRITDALRRTRGNR